MHHPDQCDWHKDRTRKEKIAKAIIPAAKENSIASVSGMPNGQPDHILSEQATLKKQPKAIFQTIYSILKDEE